MLQKCNLLLLLLQLLTILVTVVIAEVGVKPMIKNQRNRMNTTRQLGRHLIFVL